MPAPMSNIEAWLQDTREPGAAGYLPPLYLRPEFGYVPQKLVKGFPEVRSVDDKRPSQNGTFDFTEFYGACAVNLVVALAPEIVAPTVAVPVWTDERLEDQINMWLSPGRRSYLYARRKPSDSLRRVLIRSSQRGTGINLVSNAEFGEMSLAWRGIDGVWEAAEVTQAFLNPGSAVEAGRVYDKTYDITYPASAVIGTSNVFNAGTADTFPIVTIYGPCTGPRIENQTTGKKLEFLSSYVLAAGEFLRIDFKEGTVALNGDPSQSASRYDKIDFAGGISDWWNLIPRDNLLRFYPVSYTSPSYVLIEYRHAYL